MESVASFINRLRARTETKDISHLRLNMRKHRARNLQPTQFRLEYTLLIMTKDRATNHNGARCSGVFGPKMSRWQSVVDKPRWVVDPQDVMRHMPIGSSDRPEEGSARLDSSQIVFATVRLRIAESKYGDWGRDRDVPRNKWLRNRIWELYWVEKGCYKGNM